MLFLLLAACVMGWDVWMVLILLDLNWMERRETGDPGRLLTFVESLWSTF